MYTPRIHSCHLFITFAECPTESGFVVALVSLPLASRCFPAMFYSNIGVWLAKMIKGYVKARIEKNYR
jgi:hypothetical protein